MEGSKEKGSLARIANTFYRWKWFSVFILALIGVLMILTAQVLLYVHHQVKPVTESFIFSLLLPTINTLGISILSGGIFTFLMKTAEYNDLFRKEIRNAILSDEVLLHKRDQLQRILFLEEGLDMMSESYRKEIWNTLTHTFYANGISGIRKELAANLYKRLIAPERFRTYYFRDLTMQYTLKKLDGSHIEIIEEQSVLLQKESSSIELHKEYYVWKLDDPADKGEVSVQFLTVDGQDMIGNVSEIPEQKVKANGTDYLVKGKKILVPISSEKKQNEFKMILRVVHSLDTLPYWRFVLGKFTNGFSIDIAYEKQDFMINLEMIDNNLKLKDVLMTAPSIKQELQELLFPTDGFIIFVKAK